MVNKPTAGSVERRTISNASLRAEGEGDELALVGYAASFGVLSQDLGGFRETCARGCFKRSLQSGTDTKALFNHDPSRILGRRKNGTLTVSEDSRGLKFRVVLDPNNADHRQIHQTVKSGLVDECSFAFRVAPNGDSWDEGANDDETRFTRRTLLDVDLLDVSAVVYPAYSHNGATAVSARSHIDYPGAVPTASDQLARLSNMKGDWQRKEKLHRISLEILESDRRANPATVWPEAILETFRTALQQLYASYRLIGITDAYIYGTDLDDEDEQNCYRWNYELDEEGHPILDQSSRVRMGIADVSSNPRWLSSALNEKRTRKAEREKHIRANAAMGVTCRNGF